MMAVAIVLICIDQAIQFMLKINNGEFNATIIKGWLEIIPKSMPQYKGSYFSNAQKPVPAHILIFL
ncbi:MAG: hypothetical protein LBC53_08535 [Spirochaetaceae bacterium]|nr:hypothetical protein [Spirochaetaceae bacterium]